MKLSMTLLTTKVRAFTFLIGAGSNCRLTLWLHILRSRYSLIFEGTTEEINACQEGGREQFLLGMNADKAILHITIGM